MYTDVTRVAAVFGCTFELLEMDQLARLRGQVGADDIEAKLSQFSREFRVSPECSKAELARAARTSCALHRLVADKGLGTVAYYCEGVEGGEHQNIVTSVIAGNTLLTAHHVPVAGESEVKNVVAMKIRDCLCAGGSFSELYAIDYDDDVVLWGHDGPAHPAMAEGAVSLAPSRLPRQAGGRTLDPDERPPRTRHPALRGTREGRQHLSARGGRRLRERADPGDRQHQQPLSLPDRCQGAHRALVQGRPCTPLRDRRGAPCRPHRQARQSLGIECQRIC